MIRSVGYAAEWWGEGLLVTFGWAGIPDFTKVTRCKSGTIGGRYRSNGYALDPIQHPGQLNTTCGKPSSPQQQHCQPNGSFDAVVKGIPHSRHHNSLAINDPWLITEGVRRRQ